MSHLAAMKIQRVWKRYNTLKDKGKTNNANVTDFFQRFHKINKCETMFEKIHISHFNELLIMYNEQNTIRIIYMEEDMYYFVLNKNLNENLHENLNENTYQELNKLAVREKMKTMYEQIDITGIKIEGFFLLDNNAYHYPEFCSINVPLL